ncbi:MAG: hypothetical protein U0531_15675 [Dehalococcoidia bacterium]
MTSSRLKTAFNAKTANGTLAGDFSISQISDTLRRIVTEPIDGVTTGKRTLAGSVSHSARWAARSARPTP